MGFMDKAKKMAEQAQAKLDEAQKQFNSGQGQTAGAGAPPVEYDSHGRPIQPAPVTPDAAAPTPPPAAPPGVPATAPADPPAPAASPTPDPAAPDTPGTPSASPPVDPNRPSTEPPKMSQGDPLAG